MAPLREKTLLGQRRDPCLKTRAGLPGRCRPTLTRTSRSNSFECQAAAARHGEPSSPGGRASGGALLRVAAPRRYSGGGPGAGRAGGQRAVKDLLGKGQLICLYLSPRSRSGGALVRRWRAKRSVGSGVQNTKLRSAPRSRQSFIHCPAGRRGSRAGARLM